MTTGQAPIRIKTGNALDAGETTSNVATNTAELEAMRANIDGKDVYPNTVGTEHLSAANAIIHGAFKSGSMMVGSGGVVISSAADGETPTTGLVMGTSALQLIKSGEAIVALDGTTGDATFKGTIASGSTISGTMSTGSIAIGDGGVSIGSATAGIGIMGNQIFCKNAGVTTILIDGDTGNVTANRFLLTADESSSLDMSLGSLTIGAGTSVGGTTTVGDIAATATAALEVADGLILAFFQTTAPATGMSFGDIWIDTDKASPVDATCIYRYCDTSGGSQGEQAWRTDATIQKSAIGLAYLNAYLADTKAGTAQTTADGKIKTFYQTGQPASGMAVGDFWVDTDDNYKVRVYSGSSWVLAETSKAIQALSDAATAQNTATSAYNLADSALQPGEALSAGQNYMTVSSGQVTNISTAGITVGTATSGARVQLNSTGVGVYNSSNALKTTLSTDGLCVYNTSGDSPAANEALSFMNGSTIEGSIFYNHSTKQLAIRSIATDSIVNIDAEKVYVGYDDEFTVYLGNDYVTKWDNAGVLRHGDSTHTGKTLEVWNYIGVRGTGCYVQIGGGPAIYYTSSAPSFTPTAVGSICLCGNGKLYVNTTGSTWVVAGSQS